MHLNQQVNDVKYKGRQVKRVKSSEAVWEERVFKINCAKASVTECHGIFRCYVNTAPAHSEVHHYTDKEVRREIFSA